MKLQERIPLAPLTTLHIGGPARFFVEAHTDEEIKEAINFAREHSLQLFILGAGSNIFVPDAGVDGVVLKIAMQSIAFQEEDDGTLLTADAGALWGKIVDAASERELFGIENLTGIPGTAGGATVQNIGAYGAELSTVFEYADIIDSATGEQRRVDKSNALFGYRTSFFKTHRTNIIMRVALRLSKRGTPDLSYPDLAQKIASGVPLTTPTEISSAIRAIRAEKFPYTHDEGTAGSFFKNPIISHELADSLAARFAGLPLFPQENNTVKISLAWLLDHALSLKGYAKGFIRLYEKQPLVIVATVGATAEEIDAFANEIQEKVRTATGIIIEREVETFGV